MLENGKKDIFLTKSYEIAYALWRVGANIAHSAFSKKLSRKAVDLIGYAADGNVEKIIDMLPGIKMILKFGKDVGAISEPNEEIILQEIGNLETAIFNLHLQKGTLPVQGLMKEKEMNVFDIFLKENRLKELDEFPDYLPDYQKETKVVTDDVGYLKGFKNDEEPIDYQPKGRSSSSLVEKEDVKPMRAFESVMRNVDGSGGVVNGKAEIRQSAILERIRQIGNCQLNEIHTILPDTSERTIRYDLESLVQKKLIERIGTGGRGVYYRIAT